MIDNPETEETLTLKEMAALLGLSLSTAWTRGLVMGWPGIPEVRKTRWRVPIDYASQLTGLSEEEIKARLESQN